MGDLLSFASESVALAFEDDDFCVVDQAVDHGRDGYGVAEDLCPGREVLVGGDGWAEVWKRHHFAWEYKGKRKDLDAAFVQLRQYALVLENPPLLIVSDMVRFRIRTNWTNSVSGTYEFGLGDLADAATRDLLKWAFSDPERLRLGETRQALTEQAAKSFATVAASLRQRGHDPHTDSCPFSQYSWRIRTAPQP